MSRTPTPLLLALAAALPLAGASATGIDFGAQPVALGAGARALGMGGAFAAVADDASAVTWNPAGLTQCERPEAALSLGYYREDQRTQDAGHPTSQALRLDHVSALYPFFALGCQQVLGIAWQRQYDIHRSVSWRADDIDIANDFYAFKTDSQRSNGAFASLGLSYAVELVPGLSAGLTWNAWKDAWTGASHYRSETTADTHTIITGIFDVTDHLETTADTRITAGSNLVLGATWQALPALTLAVVAKPAYPLRLEQTATTHSVNDDGTLITDVTRYTCGDADIRHPGSLTLAAAWRHADRHIVSADATVTRWRQYTLDDGSAARTPVNAWLDPDDLADLWTLRLGYEYVAILPRLVLVPRCGLLLEDLPAATPAASNLGSDPGQVGATRDRWWGATAGLSLCQRRLIWDAAVQVRYGHNVGAGQYAPPDQTVDLLLTTARLGVTVQF